MMIRVGLVLLVMFVTILFSLHIFRFCALHHSYMWCLLLMLAVVVVDVVAGAVVSVDVVAVVAVFVVIGTHPHSP